MKTPLSKEQKIPLGVIEDGSLPKEQLVFEKIKSSIVPMITRKKEVKASFSIDSSNKSSSF